MREHLIPNIWKSTSEKASSIHGTVGWCTRTRTPPQKKPGTNQKQRRRTATVCVSVLGDDSFVVATVLFLVLLVLLVVCIVFVWFCGGSVPSRLVSFRFASPRPTTRRRHKTPDKRTNERTAPNSFVESNLNVVEGDTEVFVVVSVVAHGHVDCGFVDPGVLG